MIVHARGFAALTVAVALASGGLVAAGGASAATGGAPVGATVVNAAEKTVVVGGIRPGPRKLKCPGFVAHLIYDYEAGAFDSPGATKTPAEAVRRHFTAPGSADSTLDGLRYERRSVPASYANKSERRNHAIFVGLNKNRKVKARFTLDRGGSKPVKKWLISSVESCAKRS